MGEQCGHTSVVMSLATFLIFKIPVFLFSFHACFDPQRHSRCCRSLPKFWVAIRVSEFSSQSRVQQRQKTPCTCEDF